MIKFDTQSITEEVDWGILEIGMPIAKVVSWEELFVLPSTKIKLRFTVLASDRDRNVLKKKAAILGQWLKDDGVRETGWCPSTAWTHS